MNVFRSLCPDFIQTLFPVTRIEEIPAIPKIIGTTNLQPLFTSNRTNPRNRKQLTNINTITSQINSANVDTFRVFLVTHLRQTIICLKKGNIALKSLSSLP